MPKKPIVFESTIKVITKGTGCIWCPNLRYRIADEQRFCNDTGEILEDYKHHRGQSCTLTNIKERE